MMRFGCGAHVMGHGHGHRHNGDEPDASPSTGAAVWNPPNNAVDPVCGMTVAPTESKSTVHKEHVYYFCSQDCRGKFEAAPSLYTGNSAGSPHTMEQSHEHNH